jgi:hypothetical protein
MRAIMITLPIPDRAVSQNASYGNSRVAALAKSRKVKQHRHAACQMMKIAIGRGYLEGAGKPTGYALAFFYKTNLFRDEGNAEGSCKAYIDGICDALKMNDRHFNKQVLTKQAKDAKNPRVEITIYFADREADSTMSTPAH